MNRLILLIIACFCGFGCVSQKADTPDAPKKVKTDYEWDYQRVREAQAAEAAQKPEDNVSPSKTASDCRVVTEGQMKRAKLSGCKRVDERSGLGTNSYCCPQ